MSSMADSGHCADEQVKLQETVCKNSPTKQHEFEVHGSWPSTWSVCKICGLTTYSK